MIGVTFFGGDKSAAIKTAVGLEVIKNNYYADINTTEYLNLLSGYVDGDKFIPIRFCIKMSDHERNKVYVIIDSDGIEKDKIVKKRAVSEKQPDDSPLSFEISVPELAKNVKSYDLVQFFPDGLLSDKQIIAKKPSLKTEIIKIIGKITATISSL